MKNAAHMQANCASSSRAGRRRGGRRSALSVWVQGAMQGRAVMAVSGVGGGRVGAALGL